jgi:hypothetical protein
VGNIPGPPLQLQREEREGGWNLVNVEAKCRALFMYRIKMQRDKEESITADWLTYWNLNTRPENPPYPNGISEKLNYLRIYAIDAAYISGQRRTESNRVYKKKIYVSLRALPIATSNTQEMRIEKQYPHADWKTIWKNLTITPISGPEKMNWYKVIHDIIPTNVRLHRIRIYPTDNRCERNNTDTLEHGLTECAEN